MANILWVGEFFPERIERVNSITILRAESLPRNRDPDQPYSQ
jgi:hypothetical protein